MQYAKLDMFDYKTGEHKTRELTLDHGLDGLMKKISSFLGKTFFQEGKPAEAATKMDIDNSLARNHPVRLISKTKLRTCIIRLYEQKGSLIPGRY